MTFVSGLSGIPGMIRDCRDGGALRAQFLILPSALICTGRIFPHLYSSPSPVAGAPRDEFTFKPNFDLFDSTTPQSLRDSSPITHIGAVATVNKTGGSSIFLYNWVSDRNRPTVCSLSSIPNLMQDSLFVPPSVSDTCLSF